MFIKAGAVEQLEITPEGYVTTEAAGTHPYQVMIDKKVVAPVCAISSE